MKIAVSSDWHVDTVTAGVEREPELRDHIDALALFGRRHRSQGTGLIVMGDYFDPGTRRDCERAAFLIDAWRMLRDHYDWSVWLAGNHDVVERCSYDAEQNVLDFSTVLTPLRACVDSGDEWHGRTVVAEQAWAARHMAAGESGWADVAVLALPFVAACVRKEMGKVAPDSDGNAVELARDWLNEHEDRILIIAGHRTIVGIHPGSETTDMPRGGDYPIPPAALELARQNPKRVVVVNGHYHEPQTFVHEGVPISISGCPFRATFGEVDGPDRGFIVIDTDVIRAGW